MSARLLRPLDYLRAQKAYERGAHAYRRGDFTSAREQLEAAVARYPEHIAAWLGLQSLAPTDVPTCEAVYRHRVRLTPELLVEHNIPGIYYPLLFEAEQVRLPAHAAAALASALTLAGRHDEAQQLLGTLTGALDPVLLGAMQARLAYERGEYEHACELLEALADEPRLGADGQLLLGMARLQAGQLLAAHNALQIGLLRTDDPHAWAWATYGMANAAIGMGQREAAVELLSALLARGPHPEAQSLLASLNKQAVDSAQREADDRVWDSLVSALRDAPADDPRIADNQ